MRFEDISIGLTKSLTHTITQTDLERFVELTGDDNKLHVDKDFAANTSFRKPVVHGMLGASFISTIIGTKLPGDGALWFAQTLEFLLPVRVGDTLTVAAQVVKKNERDRTLELKVDILNQNRQTVTRGTSKVKMVDQEQSPAVDKHKVQEKTALVLGASGGIGFAVAEQLAELGYNLVLHYGSNIERVRALSAKLAEYGVGVYTCQADVSKIEEVEALVEFAQRKLGVVSGFVNCAATPIPPVNVKDLLWEDFADQINLNLSLNFTIMKRLLPDMLANKFGKIVTLGTVYTSKPNQNLVHYITAKSALEGFTKAFALELAPLGVNVNMVSPSLVDTELTSDIPEKTKLMTAYQTPRRRLADPADVAGAVAFLMSDRADFMAGEIIRVNGGQSMV